MTREVALKLWEKCVDAVKGSLATLLTIHENKLTVRRARSCERRARN